MQAVTRTQKRMVQGAQEERKGTNIALILERVINDDCNSLISDSEMINEVCCFRAI
jgi:hypothetical protein